MGIFHLKVLSDPQNGLGTTLQNIDIICRRSLETKSGLRYLGIKCWFKTRRTELVTLWSYSNFGCISVWLPITAKYSVVTDVVIFGTAFRRHEIPKNPKVKSFLLLLTDILFTFTSLSWPFNPKLLFLSNQTKHTSSMTIKGTLWNVNATLRKV